MTAASILTFMAAVLTVLGIADLLTGAAASRRRTAQRGDRTAPRLLRALARLGRRLKPAGAPAPRDLEARIAAAGRPGGLGAREVMAAKVAAAVGGGLLAALLSAATPGRLGVAREVGARTRGPLAAEWRTLGREVALGVPLEAALSGTVERLPLPEVRSLVAALERARRHGAPLADTLASQARDARFALARHAREEAARAGPKIQLVVALLLVPSVLLVVAAALVAALLDGGGAALPM